MGKMTMQIERATMSMATAAAIMLAVFGVGGWVAFVEYRLSTAAEDRVEDRTLLLAICRRLNCDGNGMRQ